MCNHWNKVEHPVCQVWNADCGVKVCFLCLLCLLSQLGKSVVAKVAICKGTPLSLDMFAVKVGEPKGIPPENMQQLVGKKVKVDVEEDDSILENMIE